MWRAPDGFFETLLVLAAIGGGFLVIAGLSGLAAVIYFLIHHVQVV